MRLRMLLGTPFVLLGLALLYIGVMVGGELLARIVHDAMKRRLTT